MWRQELRFWRSDCEVSEISLNVARGPVPREPIALRGSEISLHVARGPVPRELIALRGTGPRATVEWGRLWPSALRGTGPRPTVEWIKQLRNVKNAQIVLQRFGAADTGEFIAIDEKLRRPHLQVIVGAHCVAIRTRIAHDEPCTFIGSR